MLVKILDVILFLIRMRLIKHYSLITWLALSIHLVLVTLTIFKIIVCRCYYEWIRKTQPFEWIFNMNEICLFLLFFFCIGVFHVEKGNHLHNLEVEDIWSVKFLSLDFRGSSRTVFQSSLHTLLPHSFVGCMSRVKSTSPVDSQTVHVWLAVISQTVKVKPFQGNHIPV